MTSRPTNLNFDYLKEIINVFDDLLSDFANLKQ